MDLDCEEQQQQQQQSSENMSPPAPVAPDSLRPVVEGAPATQAGGGALSPRSTSGKIGGAKSASVRVVVRIRPLIGIETANGCCDAALIADQASNLIVVRGERRFQFNSTFGDQSEQQAVYEATAKPLVARCFEGYNATVFAYGQTGSGKTWTMGNAAETTFDPKDAGIIPRAVADIFATVRDLEAKHISTRVKVSYLEVHNEEIRDLLNPHPNPAGAGSGGSNSSSSNSSSAEEKPPQQQHGQQHHHQHQQGGLPLREDLNGEVTVAGLTHIEISSAKDLSAILSEGAKSRATSATKMNSSSSRSHAICTIHFEVTKPRPTQADEEGEGRGERGESGSGTEAGGGVAEGEGEVSVMTSHLHLVDLAGSERAKKTQAEGATMKEGININKGLLSLGNVIVALTGQKKGGHVPYRDSKLTRLLQDSLGGNSQTVMIACASPADTNLDESVSTLRYAGRAMKIQNIVMKNEGPANGPVSHAEGVALRQEVVGLRKEVVRLERAVLDATLKGAQLQMGIGLGGAGGGGGGASSSSRTLAHSRDGGRGGPSTGTASGDIIKEVTELRSVKRKVEEEAGELRRRLRDAGEKELTAAIKADRWKLRCEELVAEMRAKAPEVQVPAWVSEEGGLHDFEQEPQDGKDGHHDDDVSAGGVVAEQRRHIARLEEQLDDAKMATKMAESELIGGGRAGGRDSTGSLDSSFGSSTSSRASVGSSRSSNDEGEEDGEMDMLDEEGGVVVLKRVDAEIERKEAELKARDEQAVLYLQMKAEYDGLLDRLQGEKASLQSDRDQLVVKLHSSMHAKESKHNSTKQQAEAKQAESARLEKMRARVTELEAKLKENARQQTQHARVIKEKALAVKESERLRREVEEAKKRRAALQRQLRQGNNKAMKEEREHKKEAARLTREKERVQWQLNKTKEEKRKTELALKRKHEEHAAALHKNRRSNVMPGGSARTNGSDTQAAKRQELHSWLEKEVEQAFAVEMIKNQLDKHMELRKEAFQKLRSLPDTEDNKQQREDLQSEYDLRNSFIGELQRDIMVAGVPLARDSSGAGDSHRGVAKTRWARLRNADWEAKFVLRELFEVVVEGRVGLSEQHERMEDMEKEISKLRKVRATVMRQLRKQQAEGVKSTLAGLGGMLDALQRKSSSSSSTTPALGTVGGGGGAEGGGEPQQRGEGRRGSRKEVPAGGEEREAKRQSLGRGDEEEEEEEEEVSAAVGEDHREESGGSEHCQDGAFVMDMEEQGEGEQGACDGSKEDGSVLLARRHYEGNNSSSSLLLERGAESAAAKAAAAAASVSSALEASKARMQQQQQQQQPQGRTGIDEVVDPEGGLMQQGLGEEEEEEGGGGGGGGAATTAKTSARSSSIGPPLRRTEAAGSGSVLSSSLSISTDKELFLPAVSTSTLMRKPLRPVGNRLSGKRAGGGGGGEQGGGGGGREGGQKRLLSDEMITPMEDDGGMEDYDDDGDERDGSGRLLPRGPPSSRTGASKKAKTSVSPSLPPPPPAAVARSQSVDMARPSAVAGSGAAAAAAVGGTEDGGGLPSYMRPIKSHGPKGQKRFSE